MGRTRCLAAALGLVIGLSLAPVLAPAAALLADGFDGAALDMARWDYWVVWLAPTQMRDLAHAGAVVVSDGTLKLPLELHNPTALTPGDSFYGTDITSRSAFTSPIGVQVRCRLRVVDSSSDPLPRGIVAACFLFENASEVIWDEIDAPEILTNDIDDVRKGDLSARRVLTNVFNDYSTHPDKPVFVPLPDGVEATDFVVYMMRWWPDRVEWYIDDKLVRVEYDVLPDEPLNLHFNIHVPGPEWPDAWDPNLRPVDNPAANRAYYLEVDWVEVTELPANDVDQDGIADPSDNCPTVPNFGQADTDGDGLGDVCDSCRSARNTDPIPAGRLGTGGQVDDDQDGIGNRCDCDFDQNGFVNLNDLLRFLEAYGNSTGQNTCPDRENNPNGPCACYDVSPGGTVINVNDLLICLDPGIFGHPTSNQGCAPADDGPVHCPLP
jgi:hypothetical protein